MAGWAGAVPDSTAFLWQERQSPPAGAVESKSFAAGVPPTMIPPVPRVTARAVDVEASVCALYAWRPPPTLLCTWSLWHMLTHDLAAAALAFRGAPHVMPLSVNASFVPATAPS